MLTKQPTHRRSNTGKIQPLLDPVCSTYHSHPPGHLGRPSPKNETLGDQNCGLWQGSWCRPGLPYPGGLDPDGTAAQSLKTAAIIWTTWIHSSLQVRLFTVFTIRVLLNNLLMWYSLLCKWNSSSSTQLHAFNLSVSSHVENMNL